ncbi:MAG: hypothetical protein FWD57_12195 [Polyangiaceae bacterium]|nr:hypothetical protein [Polyangiaceae bacterium]
MSRKNKPFTVSETAKVAPAAVKAELSGPVKPVEQIGQDNSEGEDRVRERERQLQIREDDISARQTRLETSEARVARELNDITKRLKQVAESEAHAVKRERDIAAREIEASAGFSAANQEALAALTRTHSNMRMQVERLSVELNMSRLRGIDNLEKQLAQERRTRVAALDAEMEEERKRHKAKIADEEGEVDRAIARSRERVDKANADAVEKLAQIRVELDEREVTLRREMGRLKWKEEELVGMRASMDKAVEDRAQEQVDALHRDIEWLREDHRRDRETVVILERKLLAAQDLLARFGDNPAEIEKRIAEQVMRIDELERELLRRPSNRDKELLGALQEQSRVWTVERDKLLSENSELKAEKIRWITDLRDIEEQREQREQLERVNENLRIALVSQQDVLRAELDKLESEVNRMRVLYERPEERAARVGAIEEPWRTEIERSKTEPSDELEWLDGILSKCEDKGMRFPKRLMYAFHTSLKAAELSPLTVLAGVSGTGKSELPRLYSRYGGIGFLSLPVQPNWDSPQSLFGFFNSVDNRFNATTVLRAMVQAQFRPNDERYEHGIKDRLLLILLDEMNLAHVEQYFSDLLSRLEQRRGETRDMTLDIDMGAGMPPYNLVLGRNVLWVGTMNEDETTKALSDKVIDRSNMLYFPRPKTLHSRSDVPLGEEVPWIAERTWRGWVEVRTPFSESDLKPFKEWLQEVNGLLDHVGRALGHRVWQSVVYYMANHPDVIDARRYNDRDAISKSMRRAFEDQLVLKVMPKLRGIETSGDAKRTCLDPIRKLLELKDLGLGLSDDFDTACRVGNGAFVWSSAKYLENAE